ncbi:MAG: caspase family protein [Candidatus Omnitrophica bacterium]|nr:caspase family protein [Candidatus Omnitrophota bacterium]
MIHQTVVWYKTIVHREIFSLSFLANAAQRGQPAAPSGAQGISLPTAGSYRNSWAVVIGINRYTRAPRLNYAVNDANSVVASLKQMGFVSDKIITLLDRDATKQRIEQVLYGTLRQASPEDRLFVFFAGHGVTASLPRGGEEGYILPVDGDPDDLPLTAISMEELSRIARRVPAKHILFAVDACYSGFSITRDVPPTKVDSMYLEVVTKEPAVQIITAGRKGEPVLEEEGHGLFTRRLIQGMTGLADTDQNGIITGQELATWLESRVIRDSQSRQHPQYSRLDGEGQFVFLAPRKQQAPASAAPDEREKKLEEEIKRLALESERLKRERALFEEQRKLQAEREALLAEKRKLEEERRKVEIEAERLAKQKAQPEQPPRKAEAEKSQVALLKKPPMAPSPPCTVGLVLQFQYEDGRRFTRIITSREGELCVIGVQKRSYYDKDWVLVKIVEQDGNVISTPRPEDPLIGDKWMPFPLEVGKTWEREFDGLSGRTKRPIHYSNYYTVLSHEEIKVPAGTFQGFKIKLHQVVSQKSWGVRYFWYSPEVGYYVKMKNSPDESSSAGYWVLRDYELVSVSQPR